MRLIDADKLKQALEIIITKPDDTEFYSDYIDGIKEGIETSITIVKLAPTVEERKEEHERQAHWFVRDGYPHRVYCSLCNITFCDTKWEVWKDGSLPRAYCPNCGAKMGGDLRCQ